MGFGQVVIGPPGSGKTTYCWGLQQYFKAISRPLIIINLDPAVEELKYQPNIDIRDLIELNEVMKFKNLGPNGSILFCLEYLEENFDWLLEKIKSNQLNQEIDYIVMDLPGQVEILTDHQSLKNILNRLEKLDWRLAAVQLTDSTHIIDPAKYIAIVLLNLKSMLNLGMPHINVLTKIDLLKDLGDQFKLRLEFYTQVQDLSYLLPILDSQTTPKFSKLNRVIIELIEDFNLVGFETLCVEDKISMTKLILAIDKALGYYPSQPLSKPSFDSSSQDQSLGESPPLAGLPALPPETMLEIQERWIDFPELYQQHQREIWAQEADMVFEEATRKSQLEAIQRAQCEKQ
ncbi:hypothetical protein O181_030173 [Austropuccinia psidii MF-1]|uniref:GPN-loop GTPase 2 n=1 Tax=Austropuccinia psidii MF-1 TaxID=1389203 RepID=A0A9Q3CV10_9BASI|nr:hypothetical protein [Austropuccinia psidii MF-1]